MVKRFEGHNLDLQVAKSVTPVKVRHKQVTLNQGQIKVKLLGENTLQGHTKISRFNTESFKVRLKGSENTSD